MDYRLLASTCVDGDCPSILTDEETGDVILRSRDARDPSVERDLRYTVAEWESLLQQIGR
jgi:hypothetical protein